MHTLNFHYLLHNTTSWSEIKHCAEEATDFDARGPCGSTILVMVVRNLSSRQDDVQRDIMRRLVKRGVDVDAWDTKGKPALNQAKYLWASSLLIELGANIDVVPIWPDTIDRRWVRLAVLATPKFCEDMARMVAEMIT